METWFAVKFSGMIILLILNYNFREKKVARRKSRSSSESSGRHLDITRYSDELQKSSRSRSRKIFTHLTPSSRSPSLPSSRASSLSREHSINRTSRDVLKLMSPKVSKDPSIDFANLETRITALQKALFSEKYLQK